MSFKNSRPSHLVERPCRQCGTPTKALDVRTGRMEMHPLCPQCRGEMAKQFAQAQAQRRRQDISARRA